MEIDKLLRENIRRFQPYSSARDEFSGKEGTFLDANENSLGSVSDSNVNRYPDPHQKLLKTKLAALKQVKPEQIFLGNGSDEAIDLLIRAFCRPGRDRIVVMPPTYGMYRVCADLNDAAVVEVPLDSDFQIDLAALDPYFTPETKLIFICSPNNPSGNVMKADMIREVLGRTKGVVVVDEAYIDFAGVTTWLREIEKYDNLVVLQTFSKAWGMAGLRLGMAYANIEITAVMNKIKYPYNVNQITQELAVTALDHVDKKNRYVDELVAERKFLEDNLSRMRLVKKIFPSESNFLLVRFDNPRDVYEALLDKNIIVRDRSTISQCAGCLRITVGTPADNKILIKTLIQMDEQK